MNKVKITDTDRMNFIEDNNLPMEEWRVAPAEVGRASQEKKLYRFFNGSFSKPFKYGITKREAIDNAIMAIIGEIE